METIVLAVLMLSLSPLALTRDETPPTVADTQQLQEAWPKPGPVRPSALLRATTEEGLPGEDSTANRASPSS